MAALRLLVDNDVFILLAAADLLSAAAEVIGFSTAQLCDLGTLPFVLESRKHRDRFPATVVTQVKHLCQQISSLQEQPNESLLQLFASTPNVDSGEAVLYTLLAQTPAYLLTSNDKRAMIAIANQPALRPLHQQVAGRVICLETLLLRLLAHQGASALAVRLSAVIPLNTILRTIFTPHNIAYPDQCVAGLESYLNLLRKQVGPNFLWENK